MVRYSVLALCIQRTNARRGSRQLTSFSLAMGFCGPNLLRAAVAGERPETPSVGEGLKMAQDRHWRPASIDIERTALTRRLLAEPPHRGKGVCDCYGKKVSGKRCQRLSWKVKLIVVRAMAGDPGAWR